MFIVIVNSRSRRRGEKAFHQIGVGFNSGLNVGITASLLEVICSVAHTKSHGNTCVVNGKKTDEREVQTFLILSVLLRKKL